MPFQSPEQRKFFFAKLKSLPKGSKEYKKWKQVVNKFLQHKLDEETNSDVVVGGKDTNFGTKLTTIGQDGSAESKKEAVEKLRSLLRTKGFYVEADPHLANKIGLSPITDENTIKNIIGKKDIVFNDDGTYQRDIKGHLANKVLIGVPNYQPSSPMNEIFNSLSSLQEELTEQRKINIKESNLMKVQNFIKNKKNNYLK